jgi:hypothetical protein
MLLVILIIVIIFGLWPIIADDAEHRARLRKESAKFDEETKRYRNLLKDQIDRHF